MVVGLKRLCTSAIEDRCDYAGGRGICFGLENHGGIVSTAEEILEIIRAVKSPWPGINLDTGNFHTDDPYADLVKIAPYAVNVQMKGEVRPCGKGDEPAELSRLVKILRETNYQGYVALEYESKEDPWTAVPKLLNQMKELFAARWIKRSRCRLSAASWRPPVPSAGSDNLRSGLTESILRQV